MLKKQIGNGYADKNLIEIYVYRSISKRNSSQLSQEKGGEGKKHEYLHLGILQSKLPILVQFCSDKKRMEAHEK